MAKDIHVAVPVRFQGEIKDSLSSVYLRDFLWNNFQEV